MGSTLTPIVQEPISLDPDGAITVQVGEPRTIRVRGVDEKTGKLKDYLLKVTQSGKLLLL